MDDSGRIDTVSIDTVVIGHKAYATWETLTQHAFFAELALLLLLKLRPRLKSHLLNSANANMPEPFKLLINADRVRECAWHLRRVWTGFDVQAFEKHALTDLDALELKARAMQVATALERVLPADFEDAAALIEAALAPATDGDGLGMRSSDAGLAGWICWSLGEFIARRGLDHPQRALQALHALTQRFSAEFAIRPFLLRHPELAFRTLQRWLTDPSAHVRRLVSEGSRPRLPWGLQLKPLIIDPSPTLPLLRILQDDPSAYVRRSVANHLNDIAKDHPRLIVEWLQTHLPAASEIRRAVLRHASRTLIKQADLQVLTVWGQGSSFAGEARLLLDQTGVQVGDSLGLRVQLRCDATQTQRLAIDYLVHHVKANGSRTPKVFKGWQLAIAPGETRTLTKKHSFKPITTRVYYPGMHRIELQINGAVLAAAEFDLEIAVDRFRLAGANQTNVVIDAVGSLLIASKTIRQT